jgi:hypothetical protein
MVRAIALPLAIGVSFLVLPALVCAAEEYIYMLLEMKKAGILTSINMHGLMARNFMLETY